MASVFKVKSPVQLDGFDVAQIIAAFLDGRFAMVKTTAEITLMKIQKVARNAIQQVGSWSSYALFIKFQECINIFLVYCIKALFYNYSHILYVIYILL